MLQDESESNLFLYARIKQDACLEQIYRALHLAAPSRSAEKAYELTCVNNWRESPRRQFLMLTAKLFCHSLQVTHTSRVCERLRNRLQSLA